MRLTTATVSLSALQQNLKVAEALAPASKNVAVIKANAYGHGLLAVARALESSVPALAVALFDEAIQLRDAGISVPILVLQGTTRQADVTEAVAKDFWLMLHDPQQVARVLSARATRPVTAWLKADTGMHRLGMAAGEVAAAIDALSEAGKVRQPVVLCTHLACADEPDNPMTNAQVAALRSLVKNRKLPMSIANSAGIMCWPETHAQWNRPGYMLYGNSPSGKFNGGTTGLVPAMTLTSEIIAVRQLAPGDGVGYGQLWTAAGPSTVGTIPIGYGDGYPRLASTVTGNMHFTVAVNLDAMVG